jgi:hypothetical protein
MSSFPRDLAIGDARRDMRVVEEDLRTGAPVGYKPKGYVGQTWFGIFDSDISECPNEGLYVAYICHPDHAAVTLMVQQPAGHIDALRAGRAVTGALKEDDNTGSSS